MNERGGLQSLAGRFADHLVRRQFAVSFRLIVPPAAQRTGMIVCPAGWMPSLMSSTRHHSLAGDAEESPQTGEVHGGGCLSGEAAGVGPRFGPQAGAGLQLVGRPSPRP